MLFELDRVSLERAGKPVLRELDARLPLGATCLAGRRAPASRPCCAC
jgi:hypothetical protein